MLRRILKWVLGILIVLIIGAGLFVAWNWETVQRLFLGGVQVFETVPPQIPAQINGRAILVFSKTNGFRHEEAIPAANSLLTEIANDEGWQVFQTENGAAFSPEILSRFDAVIFNNVSGDVFTTEQRAALRAFVEGGGGFVGIHGAGGDFSYNWSWYPQSLIGAQFKGHPMDPQFQRATVNVEDNSHPATRTLPATWQRVDEWYSFERTARRPGVNVLLTLDERSYQPGAMFGTDLRMGGDHPVAWWHCVGRGRVLYSALGHQAAAYTEPHYAAMLRGAARWAMRTEGEGCESTETAP
jgi:uncharacterized protein